MPDNADLTPEESARLDELRAKRIAEDIDMMRHPDRWPDVILHLKTQPWIEPRMFGYMHQMKPHVVYLKDRPDNNHLTEVFTSTDELAKRWSVD
jgi:hypothetical protein